MTDKNNIENNLQHWMQAPPEVNEAFAWSEMQQLLQPPKKRRRILWWWWFGTVGLLMITSGFYYYFFNHTKQAAVNNLTQQAVAKQSKSVEKEITLQSNLGITANSSTAKSIAAKGLVINKDSLADNHQQVTDKGENIMPASTISQTKNQQRSVAKQLLTTSGELSSTKAPMASNSKHVVEIGKDKVSDSSVIDKNKPTFKINKVSFVNKALSATKKQIPTKVPPNTSNFNTKEIGHHQQTQINKTHIAESTKAQLQIEIDTANHPTTITIISKPKDSVQALTNHQDTANRLQKQLAKSKKSVTKDWHLSAGVDWNLQLPTTKTDYYFTNKNLTSKPINYLIPSPFIQMAFGGKHHVTLGVTPFAQYNMPPINYQQRNGSWISIEPKLYQLISKDATWALRDTTGVAIMDTSGNYRLDTSIQIQKKQFIGKAFGFSVFIDYQYRINRHWLIGGGLIYNGVTGFINQSTITRPASSNQLVYADTGYSKPNETENAIRNYFMSARASAWYNVNKWQLGLVVTIPFTGINKEGEIKKIWGYNVVIRRTIWRSK